MNHDEGGHVLYKFGVITIFAILLLLRSGNTAMSDSHDGLTYLLRGVQHVNNLDIDQAIESLQTALEVGLNEDEQVQAHYYIALMYKAEGLIDRAEAALMEVLKRKATFQLPPNFVGTDFEKIFLRTRAKVDDEAPVIWHPPIESAKVGETIDIEATVDDNSEIKTVQLVYHHSKDDQLHQVEMRPVEVGKYHVQIPNDHVRKGLIQYQILAIDGWNNTAHIVPTNIEIKGRSKRWILYLGGAIASLALPMLSR